MLELIKGANPLLRFLLELCAPGALGYWGFKTGNATITKIVLGVGIPLVAAVMWRMFVSPRAPVQLPGLFGYDSDEAKARDEKTVEGYPQ
ncbi:MAG: YrdB family protein [Actinomycetota bacterium]|nr:YrdB family protein [Actinomycetota bacterium]